jgi:hypothetical protein
MPAFRVRRAGSLSVIIFPATSLVLLKRRQKEPAPVAEALPT